MSSVEDDLRDLFARDGIPSSSAPSSTPDPFNNGNSRNVPCQYASPPNATASNHFFPHQVHSTPNIYNFSSPLNPVGNFYSPDSGIESTPPSQQTKREVYKKVKGKSSQRCRNFPVTLPDDRSKVKTQQTGKSTYWYFMLSLLKDHTKKSVIAWTGNKREFRINDIKKFIRLWSKHKGDNKEIQLDSHNRNICGCAKQGVLLAVPSAKHQEENNKYTYSFVIEPSFYIDMTREELDRVIRLHCETGPLTVGSPIDTSFGYPVGTKLKVMPLVELDEEGEPLTPIPDNFITVIAQSPSTTTMANNIPSTPLPHTSNHFTSMTTPPSFPVTSTIPNPYQHYQPPQSFPTLPLTQYPTNYGLPFPQMTPIPNYWNTPPNSAGPSQYQQYFQTPQPHNNYRFNPY